MAMCLDPGDSTPDRDGSLAASFTFWVILALVIVELS